MNGGGVAKPWWKYTAERKEYMTEIKMTNKGIYQMATYKEIQDWVREEHGFSIKSCWIAHMKEQCGLPLRSAPNRQGEDRACPFSFLSICT